MGSRPGARPRHRTTEHGGHLILRVLITGATSFIGEYLLEELASLPNVEATAIVRPSALAKSRRFRDLGPTMNVVASDIGDPYSVKLPHREYDSVVNLVGPRTREPMAQWAANVFFVRRLAVLLKRIDVGRVVHTSSVAVYGFPHRDDSPITEEHNLLSTMDSYGHTKVLSERLWARFHSETGTPVVILRPTWVVGHGSRLPDRHLFVASRRGFKLILNIGTPANIVYVRDVAGALIRAATSKSSGVRTYNINGDKAISVKAFCEAIGKEVDRVGLPLVVPRALVRLASLKLKWFRFLLTGVFFDGSRARMELGFCPKYDLSSLTRETLERMSREWSS